MNILLNGYFDKNLGDDIMQKVVVEAFPEHRFYINFNQEEMLTHLGGYDNVFINELCPQIDLFLNVIGTGFMYSGKRAKAEKLINMILSKKTKYKKSALINCSLENFDSKAAQFFADSDLKDYSLITCRDDISYNYLKKRFTSASVKKFPDMVYASSAAKVASKGEGLLGIAPVRRLYSPDNYSYYKELALLCDRYVEQYNKNVLLFAFDNGLENDLSAVCSVKEMMKNSDRAEMIMYSGNSDYIVNNMARCGLFVGSRFHSIVLARLLGIKCGAVYDREKLFRLCGEENILAVSKEDFKAETLLNGMSERENIINNYSEAKGHIDALREFIEK